MKEKIKKAIPLIILWVILILIVEGMIMLSYKDNYGGKMQYMKNLDYDITLHQDGSATIVEDWNIYIQNTNTLFRNFEISGKYGDITNVSVQDVTTGENFSEIDTEEYYVPQNRFYALKNHKGNFEIAWGIGMDDSKGTKQYKITYTVTDAVTSYNDCQEFYWKLLNEDNGISVKKVTGRIKYPQSVQNKEDLRVWGHGPLNGKVKIDSNNQVSFVVPYLSRGRMLEIRTVTKDKMFYVTNQKNNNYNYFNKIIEEEKHSGIISDNYTRTFYIIVIAIYILILVIDIIKALVFLKISKRKDDGIEHKRLKYFRDIPREGDSTPTEANYLYFFNKDLDIVKNHLGDTVSAIMLDLALKKYISLTTESGNVYVDIIADNGEGLKDDEKAVFNLLKSTKKYAGGKFNINKIKGYAEKHYQRYSNLIHTVVYNSRENLYKNGLLNRWDGKNYNIAQNAKGAIERNTQILEIIMVIFLISIIPAFERISAITFGFGPRLTIFTICLVLLPILIINIIKNVFAKKAINKIAVLTQKGEEEREEWKALAKYLKDYSLLDEKGITDLAVWEKYLVYATAFGIADEVIKQMKIKYPDVFVEEYWNNENLSQYQVLNFAISDIVYDTPIHSSPIKSISHDVHSSYDISLAEIAAHRSSGSGGYSGGGGGFSSGGGGRRRRWPECGGR